MVWTLQFSSFALLLTYLTAKVSKISIYGKFWPKVNISVVPVNHQGSQDCWVPESLWRIFFLDIRCWSIVIQVIISVLSNTLAGGIQLVKKQHPTNDNKVKNVPNISCCCCSGPGKFQPNDKRTLIVSVNCQTFPLLVFLLFKS